MMLLLLIVVVSSFDCSNITEITNNAVNTSLKAGHNYFYTSHQLKDDKIRLNISVNVGNYILYQGIDMDCDETNASKKVDYVTLDDFGRKYGITLFSIYASSETDANISVRNNNVNRIDSKTDLIFFIVQVAIYTLITFAIFVHIYVRRDVYDFDVDIN